MKKSVLVLLLIALGMWSSCTREYICQCKVKYTGTPPGIPDSSMQEFAIRDKKKEAIKKCEANSITTSQDNITMVEKCQLY